MDERTIEILDEKYNDIKSRRNDFIDSYRQALEDFLKKHHLDKDVIRTINGKEKRGVLHIAASDNTFSPCPCVTRFYPYKKDGTECINYRADYFITNKPSDAFAAILRSYKPAE